METGTTASFREALRIERLFPDESLVRHILQALLPAAPASGIEKIRRDGHCLLEENTRWGLRLTMLNQYPFRGSGRRNE